MSVEEELAAATERVAALTAECADLQEALDDSCDCDDAGLDGESPREAVDNWLTRKKGLGLLTGDGLRAVEQLLEDLS